MYLKSNMCNRPTPSNRITANMKSTVATSLKDIGRNSIFSVESDFDLSPVTGKSPTIWAPLKTFLKFWSLATSEIENC